MGLTCLQTMQLPEQEVWVLKNPRKDISLRHITHSSEWGGSRNWSEGREVSGVGRGRWIPMALCCFEQLDLGGCAARK